MDNLEKSADGEEETIIISQQLSLALLLARFVIFPAKYAN